MSTQRFVLATALALAGLLAACTSAQDKTKAQGMTFRGKVEAVAEKELTVNGEKVEGWMEAMTMGYPVDKPEVLKKIKVGDTITATVFKDDMTLHDVKVVPPAGK